MKSPLLRLFLLCIVTIAVQSCGGDDSEPLSTKSEEELATEALTGTGSQSWGIDGGGTVERNGLPATVFYEGFEITLKSGSAKTYTTKNNNTLFDSFGSWSFAGANFDKVIFSGTKPAAEREISFTRNNDNLKLTFTISTPEARINGIMAVAGNYTFNLIKK